jgi:hypothetical protein
MSAATRHPAARLPVVAPCHHEEACLPAMPRAMDGGADGVFGILGEYAGGISVEARHRPPPAIGDVPRADAAD